MPTPTLDLTTAGSSGEIGGAVFTTGSVQPAGTGVFDAFVQIQHNGTEQGYNTDAGAQYDEKNSHNHNHSILLADVPIVFGDGSNGTIDGVAYREFRLDLNDAGGTKRLLSLDKLQLWQNEAGNLTNFTPGSGFAGTHTNYLAYDLDAGSDKWIALADGNSGSGGSDYRILIPDSYFINDASHRYVTLYSQFGVQSGYAADGGFEEWGLSNPSGGSRDVLVVDKIATVAGGTADTVGEVINYTINVGNAGNTTLTGLTVSDPSVSNLAPVLSAGFNVGDVDHDGVFDAGETWQYSASHTVTQSDLDNGGSSGDETITNTVTADTLQTAPVSDTSVIVVERNQQLTTTKTADVAAVDGAGDLINYLITVENIGNTSLTNVQVNDTQVNIATPILDPNAPVLSSDYTLAPRTEGDYNVGDTNENGIEDPGETFQYKIAGDDNDNGIQDPGEEFTFANVGDTNRNSVEDPGETFQYYNAGDTDHDGEEDPGETFQFNVSHAATSVDSDDDGFNDGDINEDGQLSIGEIWQYSVVYTVTQDDIDNGGIVDPALTHDNTATVTTGQGSGRPSLRLGADRAGSARDDRQDRGRRGRRRRRGGRRDQLHDHPRQCREHDADRRGGDRPVRHPDLCWRRYRQRRQARPGRDLDL